MSSYQSTGLCPDCSMKLNYKSKKREIKRLKKNKKVSKKSKRSNSNDNDEPGTPELIDDIPTTSDVTQNEPTEKEDSSLWQKGIKKTSSWHFLYCALTVG